MDLAALVDLQDFSGEVIYDFIQCNTGSTPFSINFFFFPSVIYNMRTGTFCNHLAFYGLTGRTLVSDKSFSTALRNVPCHIYSI